MAKSYNYKKIQEMRHALKEELIETGIAILTVEHYKLIEMRIQTAIMADLIDSDIKSEVKTRPQSN